MYLEHDITIGERADKYNLTIEQWSYFYLELPIAVPVLGAIWTTTEGQEATRARMQIRNGMRADATVISLDSEGVDPAIIIDNTNAPALVVLYVRMSAILTGTFVPADESSAGSLGFTLARELSEAVYDIVIELDDDPEFTLRVMEGEIGLSEQVTRPIS
jgi:hypothetical protein